MFKGRDVISILDFSRSDLKTLFDTARYFEEFKGRVFDYLRGRILALAFFEPSTRTRLSFEVAMKRLGGEVVHLGEIKRTSIAKGESLADTIVMLSNYADAIVIRHRLEGAAKFAAEIADVPVINGGDGSQHHPTQAMIDLYTIWRELGKIDGLTVGVIGDLKYGRAACSFIYGLTLFDIEKIYLVSPLILRVRPEVKDYLKKSEIKFEEKEGLEDIIEELDVLYVTRIQKERFPDPSEYEKVKGSYIVTPEILSKSKKNLIVLHPLPRVYEIPYEIDKLPCAKYFIQAKYGVPVRMALLKLIMGE
ncbi:MAG: aspartate carbamoyltransferase [Thermoprotei archaeon]|nr:MAG: aspartate carbamoyltransferase [Thermoprotei archaeon]RLE98469.1 MAG: aspartate carbamoyltransferase [Thermoprotei archaeon]